MGDTGSKRAPGGIEPWGNMVLGGADGDEAWGGWNTGWSGPIIIPLVPLWLDDTWTVGISPYKSPSPSSTEPFEGMVFGSDIFLSLAEGNILGGSPGSILAWPIGMHLLTIIDAHVKMLPKYCHLYTVQTSIRPLFLDIVPLFKSHNIVNSFPWTSRVDQSNESRCLLDLVQLVPRAWPGYDNHDSADLCAPFSGAHLRLSNTQYFYSEPF